jgi:putative ABC transport system permease protein
VLLATVGLGSSVAYAVSQRKQEFAIRMALGASQASLVNLVLEQGIKGAAAATIAGLLISAAGAGFVGDLLYEVSPREPAVFAAVGAVVVVVAVLASLLPAWRVMRINPALALRAD